MKSSFFALLLALSLSANAHASCAPHEPANCYQNDWQTIQDAGAEAIFHGDLDNHTSDLECLKALVAHGLDLSKEGVWGSDRSSVSSAAHAGAPEILAYILSQGVSIGDMNDAIVSGNLADIAAVGGSAEVVKMLQARGMPISYQNGTWPRGYMKPSNYFLETCSPVMLEGITYLRTELVSYLLSQGMNVNARCNADSILMSNEGFNTPLLQLAASYEAFDNINGDVQARRLKANQLLKILIDAGGDVNAREDINGRSAARLLLASNWISPAMKAEVIAHVKK